MRNDLWRVTRIDGLLITINEKAIFIPKGTIVKGNENGIYEGYSLNIEGWGERYEQAKVGDILPKDLLSSWTEKNSNYYYSNESGWRNSASSFSNNRKIASIKNIKGKLAALVSNTTNVWIALDGWIEHCFPSEEKCLSLENEKTPIFKVGDKVSLSGAGSQISDPFIEIDYNGLVSKDTRKVLEITKIKFSKFRNSYWYLIAGRENWFSEDSFIVYEEQDKNTVEKLSSKERAPKFKIGDIVNEVPGGYYFSSPHLDSKSFYDDPITIHRVIGGGGLKIKDIRIIGDNIWYAFINYDNCITEEGLELVQSEVKTPIYVKCIKPYIGFTVNKIYKVEFGERTTSVIYDDQLDARINVYLFNYFSQSCKAEYEKQENKKEETQFITGYGPFTLEQSNCVVYKGSNSSLFLETNEETEKFNMQLSKSSKIEYLSSTPTLTLSISEEMNLITPEEQPKLSILSF